MVKATQQAAISKPAKPVPKPKLSFWEEIMSRGIGPAIASEIKDVEMAMARKEKAITTKEAQAEKLRLDAEKLQLDAEKLRSQVATLKVIIFRNCKS